MGEKVTVDVYGSGKESKLMWVLIRCDACHKELCLSNFKDDETFLCADCFKKWNGRAHPTKPYSIEIEL